MNGDNEGIWLFSAGEGDRAVRPRRRKSYRNLLVTVILLFPVKVSYGTVHNTAPAYGNKLTGMISIAVMRKT